MQLDEHSRATLPKAVQPPFPASTIAGQKPLSERERFVLTLFRHLAVFRSTYEEEALLAAARHVERSLGRDQADDVMAAAVLLDNEMRCHTELAFALDDPCSQDVGPHEYDFLALLKAAAASSDRAAIGACSRLDVSDNRALLACARRLARTLGWTSGSDRSGKSAASRTAPVYTGL